MKRAGGLLVALVAVLLLVMGLLPQCARRVALSGGERDSVAPHIVRAIPPSGSTHFAGNRIRLTFVGRMLLRYKVVHSFLTLSIPCSKTLPTVCTSGKPCKTSPRTILL